MEYQECHKEIIDADAVADRAVKKCFAILGVDVDSPEKVEEFRKSLRFGDTLRKAAERGVIVFVSSLVAATLAVLWYGIKHSILGE